MCLIHNFTKSLYLKQNNFFHIYNDHFLYLLIFCLFFLFRAKHIFTKLFFNFGDFGLVIKKNSSHNLFFNSL